MPNEPTQGVERIGTPVEGTPVEAPPVPVQQTAPVSEIPADIQPTYEVEPEAQGPAANMGDLPQWDTVLSLHDFQSMGKGEQNKFREKWLRQMSDQNPSRVKRPCKD